MLCLAWQNLIFPLVRLALGHNYCLSYLNFHVYNIPQKPPKVKKNFQLFFCTILLPQLPERYSLILLHDPAAGGPTGPKLLSLKGLRPRLKKEHGEHRQAYHGQECDESPKA